MILEFLNESLTVCKIKDAENVDLSKDFTFLFKTDNEVSLVCRSCDVPEDTIGREDGWCALRIAGKLDFSLIGIISGISKVLADNSIGLFVISTFDTDYVLIKQTEKTNAIHALRSSGYVIEVAE